MSKRNTRLRVARVAAAAVIAGGASLTAVGAAQAVTPNNSSQTPAIHTLDEPTDPLSGASGDGGSTSTPTEEPPTSPTEEPPTSPTEEPPTSPTEEPPTSPTEEPPTSPTEEPPTSPTEEPPTSSGTTNGTTSGNDSGGPTSTPSKPSGTNPDGNNSTCTLTGDSVDCGNNDTGTDDTQQVAQGDTTSQLAETGSNGTTFLLIGAATLVAGGIGFRLTPRLAAGRGRRDAA